MKKIRLPLHIFLAAIFLASGIACKKSSDSNGAPALPPAASIDMNGLSSFVSLKKSTSISPDSSHYKTAWRIVHTWDSVSVKLVSTPKLILLEALNGKSAVYDAVNKQWTWTYIKSIAGDGNYQAVLTATMDTDSVDWTMNVSRINGDGLYNFKWIEGRTDTKRTGGWWTLYEPISKKSYLLITWKQESELVKWIQYTNIIEGDGNKGGYISFGTSTDVDYNAYFNIFSAASGKTAKIAWNTSTMAGQLICDGNTYGWDATLTNN